MGSAASPQPPSGDAALQRFQRALNSDLYLPGTAYRRNTGLYELVCCVNNIGATLHSGRYDIAALFVARAAERMNEIPATPGQASYYELVSRYLAHVVYYIRNSGSSVDFDAQRIPASILSAGPQDVPGAGV